MQHVLIIEAATSGFASPILAKGCKDILEGICPRFHAVPRPRQLWCYWRQRKRADVRFGSLAGMTASICEVYFSPKKARSG
jgi:hypothetical protein